LNDNYEGGEFKLFDGKTIEQKPGRLIIHPAFAGHQITEITKGERYSCVAWAVGDTFV
jgi:predicted 2-oxoglutarate/Fe(II)-dependent dioxygenase YbiX